MTKEEYRDHALEIARANGVQPGWFPLICTAVNLMWNQQRDDLPEIAQIKEKFGTMRFYAYNTTREVDGVIHATEAYSAHVCEYCGDQGSRCNPSGKGWIKTLCERCFNEAG